MYSDSTTATMSQDLLESDWVKAFEQKNKQDTERLLLQIGQPADIRISYYVPGEWWYAKLVSLLHLAAAHGWMDIIIDLITKYKCNTNCKDSRGRTPLHYAVLILFLFLQPCMVIQLIYLFIVTLYLVCSIRITTKTLITLLRLTSIWSHCLNIIIMTTSCACMCKQRVYSQLPLSFYWRFLAVHRDLL